MRRPGLAPFFGAPFFGAPLFGAGVAGGAEGDHGGSSAVQARDAATGCSSGQAPLAGPAGLPNNCRAAAATALTGFQSAIVRSQAGMPPVGTNTLDSMVTGKIRIEACAAVCSLPMTRLGPQFERLLDRILDGLVSSASP